jgi:hypothetical protein
MTDSLTTPVVPKTIGHDGNDSIPDLSSNLVSLDNLIANIYESVSPLGGNALPLSLTKHKPTLCTLLELCRKLHTDIGQDDLREYSFLTLRPSPEFMYSKWSDRIIGYSQQLQQMVNHMDYILENIDCNLLSMSIEKGTNKSQQQILHFHMIWHGSKKGLSRMKKYLINAHTNLHKVYGYQKALKESDTDAQSIFKGILYFNGIKVSQYDKSNKKYTLKPDIYKHMIFNRYLKNI